MGKFLLLKHSLLHCKVANRRFNSSQASSPSKRVTCSLRFGATDDTLPPLSCHISIGPLESSSLCNLMHFSIRRWKYHELGHLEPSKANMKHFSKNINYLSVLHHNHGTSITLLLHKSCEST